MDDFDDQILDDISLCLWVECFSILAGVLTTKYPERAPDLIAYQKTIVHASRSFAGDHWVTYDLCYRRRAVASKSLHWSHIDFSLYNETFTGMAKALPRCRYCLNEYHRSAECMFAPEPTTRYPSTSPRNSRPQLCCLFNARSGDNRPCVYLHLCSNCRESHPASTCKFNRPPPPKQPRTDNGPSRKAPVNHLE